MCKLFIDLSFEPDFKYRPDYMINIDLGQV